MSNSRFPSGFGKRMTRLPPAAPCSQLLGEELESWEAAEPPEKMIQETTAPTQITWFALILPVCQSSFNKP